MLTSAQVAAMMQQQNQQFMGMQQYSQVISSQMPQMYGGIGSYGMQGPTAPQFAQVPYAPRQHAGFSYGGSPFGYGLGNSVGAAGVSALGGAGQFALGAAGIAGGLGLMGRAGMMFDPMGAGMGAFGAARAAGMGMMGGLGMGAMAAGAVALPMMAAQHALGSMVTGAQEQAGVNQALGQYNFINPMSRSGRGFSRQDAMAIGSMAREMQSIPEMMTSMSELTRIMDKLGQSGLMQGVTNAQQFATRFKETIHTLKDISKMMGSTMEEAMQTFQASRQAGFYSPQAIRQNVMQAQIVSGLTGMNTQQVFAMQRQGAELSHAMGGSRAGGARSVGRIAGELGMANRMGMLSNDQIMEMTGMEGDQGIQALAGSLNEAGQRMGRSSLGTAMTLALGEVKDGRYTGGMDADLVRRVRNGEISKSELLQLAHKKSAGRNAKLSFAAHRQRLTTEMVNSAGVQGISMELGEILGERGFDNPDALNLVMQRYGVGEEQANQVISMMKKMPEIQRGMQGAGTAEARRMAEQAFMKENASWEGIKHKIGKKFENVFTEPFKKFGANIANSVSETIDSFVDDIFGRYQSRVTDMANSTTLKAAMGDKKAMSMVAAARGVTGGNDLRNNSLVGGALNYLGGQQTAGDVQASILRGMGSDYYDTVQGTGSGGVDKMMEQQILKSGGSILSKEGGIFNRGEYTIASASQKARAIKALQGKNQLEGKIDVSQGYGKFALAALKHQLMTNDELMKGDLSDQEKYEILRKGINDSGAGDILGRMSRAGGGSEIDILDALAKAGGLSNQAGMFSRSGLVGGLQGGGSSKIIAKQIDESIKTASGGFGDKSAMARTALSEGGGTAKILSMAFGGGDMQDKIRMALGTKDGAEIPKEVLDALGMTQKEFEAAKDQSRELLSAGIKGGAKGSDIQDVIQKQLSLAVSKNAERGRDIGTSLAGRLSSADLGGLSKAGQGIAGQLRGLADRLGKTGDFGDTSGLLTALADYKGADRSKLMGLAGEEIGAGVQEITDVRRAYSRSRSVKGGKSVDALIEKLGLSGDVAKMVREKAGSDNAVSGSEEKDIEKFLGDLRTKNLASAKGAESGTVNASKTLQSYFDAHTKSMENVATVLQGLVAMQKGVTTGETK